MHSPKLSIRTPSVDAKNAAELKFTTYDIHSESFKNKFKYDSHAQHQQQQIPTREVATPKISCISRNKEGFDALQSFVGSSRYEFVQNPSKNETVRASKRK